MERGGKRPGAGAKAKPANERCQTVCLSVDLPTRERMSRLRAQGVRINDEFKALIYQLSVSMGLEPDDDPTI